ncbi:MAG: hypothetical protein IJY70_05425 [Clostridia bacterium]|nr:hypothetical protein [Clostridia bacterium]
MKRFLPTICMAIILAVSIFSPTVYTASADIIEPVGPSQESLESCIDQAQDGQTFQLPARLVMNKSLRLTRNVVFERYDGASVAELAFNREYNSSDTKQENYRHFVIANSGITVTFNGITFSAQSFGGGITDGAQSVSAEKAKVIFNDCVFKNCKATDGGAVLCYDSVNYEFNNCQFLNNEATRGGAVAVRDGGEPVFNGCTFSGNIASEYGSAIAVINNYLSFDREVKITDCIFKSNLTFSKNNSYAGALAFIELNRSITEKENPEDAMPKYSKSKGKSTVDNCVFEDNMAFIGGGYYPAGSAICAENMEITVKNSSFNNNVNHGYGTIAVSFPSAKPALTIENITINDNFVARYGGSLYLYSATDFVFTPINTVFGRNYSINGGEIALMGKLPNGNNTVEINWVGASDILDGYTLSQYNPPKPYLVFTIIAIVSVVVLSAVAVFVLYKFVPRFSKSKANESGATPAIEQADENKAE